MIELRFLGIFVLGLLCAALPGGSAVGGGDPEPVTPSVSAPPPVPLVGDVEDFIPFPPGMTYEQAIEIYTRGRELSQEEMAAAIEASKRSSSDIHYFPGE
ncbi:hypothetical protein BJY16_006626 [Actinoplanes octamycinicus]|uniref:Uncharacterized protein n=1 Tax=Actinoplanes octamycinicus TaxID=135948 RepID=A0A7W7H3U9_9ACTN|nr:hypothetical protein [Actinoplanes octamycinicus]GIE61271.1 hypothetical protein Aoc01nite_66730 [Actinoplanes octamycinicus]